MGFVAHQDGKNRIADANWDPFTSVCNDLFVWRSVMTEDELSDMEKRRQESWPQGPSIFSA